MGVIDRQRPLVNLTGRLIYRSAFVLLGAWLVFVAGALGYWWRDRSAVPTGIRSAEIVRSPAYLGRGVSVRWKIYRHQLCQVTRSEHIIDANQTLWDLPQQAYLVPPGKLGEDEFVTVTPVPMWAALGPAKLRIQLIYVCNPLQRLLGPVVTHVPDMEFVIADSKP